MSFFTPQNVSEILESPSRFALGSSYDLVLMNSQNKSYTGICQIVLKAALSFSIPVQLLWLTLLYFAQVNKFLYTCLKLNSLIMRYSVSAAVVLVSLPPPPPHHPAYCYMEYTDLLVESIPRLLLVRGYRRDVVTIFT